MTAGSDPLTYANVAQHMFTDPNMCLRMEEKQNASKASAKIKQWLASAEPQLKQRPHIR